MRKTYPMLMLSGILAGKAVAQAPFEKMEPNYTSTTVLTAPTLKEQTLFREGQHWLIQKRANGYVGKATAPSQHDYMYYEPLKGNRSDRGYLVLNFERSTMRFERPELGEGGGMGVVQIQKVGDEWRIFNDPVLGDTSRSIDFSNVGWTTTNCGGAKLPNGHHITGEEIFDLFRSNTSFGSRFNLNNPEAGYVNGEYTIPADYPEFGGMKIPMHQNFGWMTEVDPVAARAVHKNYHMGRFSHEGGVVMPDRRTVYLTDDYTPACLFKFVADKPNDYRAGNLYAFKQNPNSTQGTWVQIPRNLPALINAREEAVELGATLFIRLEWADLNPKNGKVYIAETGADNVNLTPFETKYGQLSVPQHWKTSGIWNAQAKVADHPYGAVLELDDRNPQGPSVRSYLNGGTSSNGKYNFASVDGIKFVRIGNKNWLILQEDLIGIGRGRMPAGINHVISEAFFLDASLENPTVDDLHLVFASSRGAEVTGACFTPDGTTMFINNQHPSSSTNSAPYDRTATIAVTGFSKYLVNIPEINPNSPKFVVYPNPAFQSLHFNQVLDVALYDEHGNVVAKREKSATLDVSGLPKGTYYLKTSQGETHRIVKE